MSAMDADRPKKLVGGSWGRPVTVKRDHFRAHFCQHWETKNAKKLFPECFHTAWINAYLLELN